MLRVAGHSPLSGLVNQSTIPVGSAVALTTATPANITSQSLGPGTYLVWASADFALAAASTTQIQSALSLTSATMPTQAGGGGLGPDPIIILPLSTTTLTGTASHIVGPTILTIAATTTLFMVLQSTFSAGAVSGYGTLNSLRLDLP